MTAQQIRALYVLRSIEVGPDETRMLPHCVSCDVLMFVEAEWRGDGAGRLRLGHPIPLCPEFARVIEDLD